MNGESRGNSGRWMPAAEPAILERLKELQEENARLQGLICYLLHTNEELRQKKEQ